MNQYQRCIVENVIKIINMNILNLNIYLRTNIYKKLGLHFKNIYLDYLYGYIKDHNFMRFNSNRE
jgi:hypothetical protein